jgi:hypothetical protein
MSTLYSNSLSPPPNPYPQGMAGFLFGVERCSLLSAKDERTFRCCPPPFDREPVLTLFLGAIYMNKKHTAVP